LTHGWPCVNINVLIKINALILAYGYNYIQKGGANIMARFTDKTALLIEVERLTAMGINCSYREATSTEGFNGWILFYWEV